MNRALRRLYAPLRICDALRYTLAKSVSTSPIRVAEGFSHRADAGGVAAATDVVTKLAVVLLSSVNSVMWWVYTESRLMGAVWAVTAIGFAVWTKRDAARR